MLENAAMEPEIVDLADCLIAMGAQIEGAGTGRIVVRRRRTPAWRRRIRWCRTASKPARSSSPAAMTGGRVTATPRASGNAGRGARQAARKPAPTIDCDGRPHHAGHAGPASARGQHHHRAAPGVPDRHAGAVHGAELHRRRRRRDQRDDLRKPLHARAGTAAPGRGHPRRRPHRDRARRRASSAARR